MLYFIFLLFLFCSFSTFTIGEIQHGNFRGNGFTNSHESQGEHRTLTTSRPLSTTITPYRQKPDTINLNVTFTYHVSDDNIVVRQQLSNLLINQYVNHPKGRFFVSQMHSSNDSEIMYYLLVTLIVMFGFFLFCLFVVASAIAIFLCFSIFTNK
uniref:Uncharacterized protein n=1 Tax=Panagrolaimus sp. PS1159 TaxID=55785 RepID=A0AC35GVA6_9BILA